MTSKPPILPAPPLVEGAPHNRALDGLRFFAFLGVFLYHAIGGVHFLLLGAYGVRVFFTLSGFLIGRILLNQRTSAATLPSKLRTFYSRRILRIFPLYYAILVLVWLLPRLGCDALGISHGLPWQFAYLTNIYIYRGGAPGCTSHFWSLAIEEQFYLIAPLALLAVRPRVIELGLVCLWCVNASLHLFNWMTSQNPDVYLLPNFQFGYLGFGIAAAMIQQRGTFLGVTPRLLYGAAICCVPAAAAMVVLWMMQRLPESIFLDLFEWPVTLISAGLILALWRGECGVVGRLLSFAPIVYLGRISYGLYVFHYLVIVFLNRSDMLQNNAGVFTLVAFCGTTLLAAASWHLFEQPINRLKSRFSYDALAGICQAACIDR